MSDLHQTHINQLNECRAWKSAAKYDIANQERATLEYLDLIASLLLHAESRH